jgi:hypothetical protein
MEMFSDEEMGTWWWDMRAYELGYKKCAYGGYAHA